MTLIKKMDNFHYSRQQFQLYFHVKNHRKTYVLNLRGREGVSKQAQCLNFVCPKVPGEGRGQGNLGLCLKFYCFFKASLSFICCFFCIFLLLGDHNEYSMWFKYHFSIRYFYLQHLFLLLVPIERKFTH